ncbi:MAG: T9SS type A sorting domain-containing protein [Bacteroidetes bacterium]|nr:MAG: T9SS type A sorting domain-containing protein [Bacteroidota bacterium]
MKSNFTTFVILALVVCGSLVAQTTGDYRSNGSGNWGDNTKWETYVGSAWVGAVSAPTGTGTITLRGTDSLFMNVAVTITGTLVSDSGEVGNSETTMTFAPGSMFLLPINNGTIPLATWDSGSTCKITGYVSGSKPANANQNFYNLTWDCPNQSANVDLSMSGNTIGGDVTIDTTGLGRMYLTSPAGFSAPITIHGNIYMRRGQFSSNGSSSADTIIIHTMGDIIVTGGNFSLSRGSGTDVHWYHHGEFSVSDATLQNSGGSTKTQRMIFAGSGTQNITLSNVTYGTGTSHFNMRVQNGSTVNLGQTVISSSNTGSFIVESGATIETAQPGGFEGNIQSTGANGGGNSLSTGANYTFNGSSAQVTGTLMPDTVHSLTLNNTSGVTLSRATVINDTLHLVAGEFDNTIPFTLGANGYVSFEGGSVKVPLGIGEDGEILPAAFSLQQNYPNPFNPTTNIQFQISDLGFVSLKVFNALGMEVATIVNKTMFPGAYTVQWDATGNPSGMYMVKLTSGSQVLTKSMILAK